MSSVFFVAKRLIPRKVKVILKVVLAELKDVLDRITGKRTGVLPPTRLLFDGSPTLDDYLQGGEIFMKHFLALLKPKSDYTILDIGSGIGRHTLPLTKYLNKKGAYEGFEIVKAGVKWCNSNITSRFPNFRFKLVDIHNGSYNPKGKVMPEKFVFPYPDNTFDVVLALSVFTHMTPPGVRHYLKEVNRVLKPGGRSFLTYFLLNKESTGLLNSESNTQKFMKTKSGYWTTNKELPELAIAYEESSVRKYYADSKLKITKIAYGSWCGRKKYLDYQDIVIAAKR